VDRISLNHPAVRAAIVDLDGTMVDTLGDFTVALNRMAQQLRLSPIEAGAIEAFVGKGTEHLVRSVLAHLHAPPDVYEQALRAYLREYEQINGEYAQVYPGVIEGLGALRSAGLRLVCVTNKPTAFARPLLQAKQLARFFDAVFGGDAFERKKPDPLPLLKTCEALGTPPARTLMVGDSRNDAAAARAAGCPIVLVTYGYNHGEPVHTLAADGYVDSLAELASLLRR
jgi:phosphoglycolate phosphatase